MTERKSHIQPAIVEKKERAPKNAHNIADWKFLKVSFTSSIKFTS